MPMLRSNIAIDLGTANVLVYVQGRGIVIREPSVVALRAGERNQVVAVGESARSMMGRTPDDIVAVRPLKDGVIADFDITRAMLRYFLKRVLQRQWFLALSPNVVVCVPCGVTDVERRAVKEAMLKAGAWNAVVADEPLAAAIGAGMPVGEPLGNMIVDIGGGTCEVAVVSLGSIVVSRSIRVGGNRLDEAIAAYLRKHYDILIGDRTAEDIKINIGSAIEPRFNNTMTIRGQNIKDGLPRTVEISAQEVRAAMAAPLARILEAICATLEATPPELAADVMHNGMMLSGGTSLLPGLDVLVYRETGIQATLCDHPMEAVALGAGRIVEEFQTVSRMQREHRGAVYHL